MQTNQEKVKIRIDSNKKMQNGRPKVEQRVIKLDSNIPDDEDFGL